MQHRLMVENIEQLHIGHTYCLYGVISSHPSMPPVAYDGPEFARAAHMYEAEVVLRLTDGAVVSSQVPCSASPASSQNLFSFTCK